MFLLLFGFGLRSLGHPEPESLIHQPRKWDAVKRGEKLSLCEHAAINGNAGSDLVREALRLLRFVIVVFVHLRRS